jgi:multidrug efflux pump
MISSTLNDLFGQRQVSTIYNPLNQYRVVMEASPEFWQSPESLKDVYLIAPGGQQVPLSAIARYQPTSTPLQVSHQGQFAASTISFSLSNEVSMSQATDLIMRAVDRLSMPSTVTASFQGNAKAFQSAAGAQPLLILAAIIAVYLVLGVLYESYIHPLTILSTLPSAGVGALLALMMFDTEFSLIALIGVILLIGIVKKNGIMMVDFAISAERRDGLTPLEAIRTACLLRFRPILMTTMAALLSGLPLMLGHGAGSELRRPLGYAMVGGLLLSQVLTLYTTPGVYLYLDRLQRRLAPRRASRMPHLAEKMGAAAAD